jgi:DNA-binding NtrC family response regulator
MSKLKGQIILVDDEQYEEDFLKESLDLLEYDVTVKYFNSAVDGLDYIRQTNDDIFLIISDIHLMPMSGIELKKAIDEDPMLKFKAIPFVFATTVATKDTIELAYKHNVQGFFEKPAGLEKLSYMLSTIIKYWIINLHPNNRKFVTENQY